MVYLQLFSEVFSVIQKKCLGNFKEDNKVSWWIHIFVESACRKAGLLYHLCWNIRVIHSLSATVKNQGLFMSGLGFDLLVESQVKTLILQCSTEKTSKFHWNWRLRRQPAVSVPKGLCAQSCYRLQWEFCLSTKRWTGTKSRSRGHVAASPENEAYKGHKMLWLFFFFFSVIGYRHFRFKLDTFKLEGEPYSHW